MRHFARTNPTNKQQLKPSIQSRRRKIETAVEYNNFNIVIEASNALVMENVSIQVKKTFQKKHRMFFTLVWVFSSLFLGCLSDCVCPSTCSFGYRGTQAQCFCWAQGMARIGKTAGTISYFPHAQYSTGGCSYCPQQTGVDGMTAWIDVIHPHELF